MQSSSILDDIQSPWKGIITSNNVIIFERKCLFFRPTNSFRRAIKLSSVWDSFLGAEVTRQTTLIAVFAVILLCTMADGAKQPQLKKQKPSRSRNIQHDEYQRNTNCVTVQQFLRRSSRATLFIRRLRREAGFAALSYTAGCRSTLSSFHPPTRASLFNACMRMLYSNWASRGKCRQRCLRAMWRYRA